MGRGREELLGRTLLEVFPDAAGSQSEQQYQRVLADRVEAHFTEHYVEDGVDAFVEVGAYPMEDGGIAVFWRDVTTRATAERELAASEARFRAVFERAAVGMGRVRLDDARWLDVNGAFCSMLGRSREEMLATPWPEMTHLDDVVLDFVPFHRMAAGELESHTVEQRFVHRSGRHVWARLTFSLVRDAAGRPDYEIAVIEDMGERRQAAAAREAALLAGEVGTFAWDTIHQRVSGDANFARMFGIPLDVDGQAPLDRYIDVIHPDDRTRMQAAVARTVDGGADYEVEYRVVGEDGAVRWLLVRAKPERDVAGRVVRAPGVCLDVTARKQAEDELRRSTTLMRAISDATGDVIYAKDRDGRLTYGNPATFALIGKPAEKALGHTDAEFLEDAEAAQAVMEHDHRIMTTGRTEEIEEVIPLADGTPRVWASYKTPYRNEHGAVIGLLGLSRDVTERVEARRRLSAALTAGEVGTFEWDVVADRLYGDANFARMFGLTLAADGSAPLQRYLDVIHPDDQPAVIARVTRTLEDGVPYEAEYRILGPAADDVRWVIARGLVERDPTTRQPLRFLGTILDITERKTAEQALEAERALLGAILEQMPVGVAIAEAPGGRLLFINAAGVRVLGHPSLDARTTEEYAQYGALHPDDTPYASAEYPLARAVAGESVVEHVVRYRRGDGVVAALALSAAPVYDVAGRHVRAVCAWSDITERIALEDALRDARQRVESIIDSIDDGLLVMDHAWRYTYFSRRAAEITGVRREDVLGGVVWNFHLHAEGTKCHECYHRAVETGEPVHFEEFYPEPMNKWLEYHCYPGPEGLTVFFRDVTERKAAEAERERLFTVAAEANTAKSAFLASMSHELRTPLNAIGGHVQLIELGLHGPVTARQTEALARVQQAQRHLLGIINDILNFARLEAAAVAFDVKAVRVGEVIDAARRMIEPQLAAKALVYEMRMPDPAPEALADPDKLVQILLNLLANAVMFTPARQPDGAPGRITVEVTVRDDAPHLVDIHVQDTGIGIPADKLQSIFEPFVQVAIKLSERNGGTGLGLAISRDLARGMAGELTVESTLGVGSTFTLTLPEA